MPAIIELHLIPSRVPEPLPYLGGAVRAFVYDCLTAAVPQLADHLHDQDQYEPFCLSAPIAPSHRATPRTPEAETDSPATPAPWRVRCGCLAPQVADGLAEGLWLRHRDQPEVQLGPASFHLADPPWTLKDNVHYAQLAAVQPSPTWTLQFLTPTAVVSQGVQMPFPAPAALFGSLLLKWNALAHETLWLDTNLLDEFGRAIALSAFEGRTRPVRLVKTTLIGFVGEATFRVLTKDDAFRQTVATLMNFARFAGIGMKTTIGMGQVVVRKGSGRSRQDD